MKRYVVVGGGLAGLTAANALAGEGRHKVTLLERSNGLGGRATTRQDRGCFLNLGPHALHTNAVAARTFRDGSVANRRRQGAKHAFLDPSIMH